MNDKKPHSHQDERRFHPIQRHMLGVLAVLGLVLWYFFGLGPNASSFGGVYLKVGMVLGAMWLALPQLERFRLRIPTWLIWVALGVAFFVNPRVTVVLAVVYVVMQVVDRIRGRRTAKSSGN